MKPSFPHAPFGLLCGILSLLSISCFSTPLDPSLSGVFVCEQDEDCPSEQACVLNRCVSGGAPKILLSSPEAFQQFEHDPDAVSFVIRVRLRGQNLTLVDDSNEPRLGEGRIVIYIDGKKVSVISKGDLTVGVGDNLIFEIPNTPGAHRIEAVAETTDGEPYDTPQAVARHIIWLDDGNPAIAILDPWPNTVLPSEGGPLFVEFTTNNFTLTPTHIDVAEPHGHGHVHYGDSFPQCTNDPACDISALGILIASEPGQSVGGEAVIPPAGSKPNTLSVVLRQNDHSPYYIEEGKVVFDVIDVKRD